MYKADIDSGKCAAFSDPVRILRPCSRILLINDNNLHVIRFISDVVNKHGNYFKLYNFNKISVPKVESLCVTWLNIFFYKPC